MHKNKNVLNSSLVGFYEKDAWSNDEYVCGVDEVGRGCLFGPVVVTAAILPINTKNKLLKDSKSLSKQQLKKAYESVVNKCFYSSVFVDAKTIDTKNIFNATHYAMKKAYIQIIETTPFSHKKIRYLISDAMKIKLRQPYKHESLIQAYPAKAESLSITVAAASIIAKITRDRSVEKLSKQFPYLQLEKHKGYGTKAHIEAIKQYGASIMHRKTFVPKTLGANIGRNQQSIC